MLDVLGTAFLYGMVIVGIVSPKMVRALYRRISPNRSQSGFMYTDYFTRLLSILVLISFLLMERFAFR